MLGGLLRALFIFPEPSFLLFFVFLFCEILMYSSGSRVVVRLISLWVLPPLLLLFCGSVFRSCRGLPPHIKLHSPLGGESGASCVGRVVCPLLLLLFLLRVCFSWVVRVCLLFAPPPVVGSHSDSGSCGDLVAQAPCLDSFGVLGVTFNGHCFPSMFCTCDYQVSW